MVVVVVSYFKRRQLLYLSEILNMPLATSSTLIMALGHSTSMLLLQSPSWINKVNHCRQQNLLNSYLLVKSREPTARR